MEREDTTNMCQLDDDEYGLLYFLDVKTYFWLEETEKLAHYDLYQKPVRAIFLPLST
jgi:hypothetical protein